MHFEIENKKKSCRIFHAALCGSFVVHFADNLDVFAGKAARDFTPNRDRATRRAIHALFGLDQLAAFHPAPTL